MIEFTLSRVVLCVCGLAMLATVSGAVGAIYDTDRGDMDGELADRLAHMMDAFESSDNDTIVLDGSRILPNGYAMKVHDGFVELIGEGRKHISVTSYQGEFELDSDGIAVVTHRRSRQSSSRYP